SASASLAAATILPLLRAPSSRRSCPTQDELDDAHPATNRVFGASSIAAISALPMRPVMPNTAMRSDLDMRVAALSSKGKASKYHAHSRAVEPRAAQASPALDRLEEALHTVHPGAVAQIGRAHV